MVERMLRLTRNAAQCLAHSCMTIIESKSPHDRVTCKCGRLSVDGGLVEQKVIGELRVWKDLSEWETGYGNVEN